MKDTVRMPCPFCGAVGEDLEIHYDLLGGMYMVHCINCGTLGPTAIASKSAWNFWNEREVIDETTDN